MAPRKKPKTTKQGKVSSARAKKSKNPRRKPGNQPFKPTDKQRGEVTLLRRANTTPEVIADIVGCGVSTLYRHFRPEMEHGIYLATARVAAVAYRSALKAETDPKYQTSMIFWLKTHGFRETTGVEVSGPEGKPITIENADATEILRDKLKLRVEREAAEIVEQGGM